MFYKPNFRPETLPHDPFKAIVSPRPIGWISTINKDGSANLAPYSFLMRLVISLQWSFSVRQDQN